MYIVPPYLSHWVRRRLEYASPGNSPVTSYELSEGTQYLIAASEEESSKTILNLSVSSGGLSLHR